MGSCEGARTPYGAIADVCASRFCGQHVCPSVEQDEAIYKKLPEPHEDELDMLDLAFGLTDT